MITSASKILKGTSPLGLVINKKGLEQMGKRNLNQKKNAQVRVGLYIRVSTEEQALNPEGSIKNQEERLLQAVKLKQLEGQNVEVFKTYIDRAKSGKDTKRPKLQEMLQDIRDQKLELVMSSELSRISRNMKDFSEIWELMKFNECGFQSLRENFDTTTAAGEMVLYTIANIAQFERRQVSERVSANINERSRRGLYNGGSVPIGYKLIENKPGFLQIDSAQAKVVKTAFEIFLKEDSLSTTAKWLNKNGYSLKKAMQGGGNKARTGVFHVDNLHRMLTNICYIGKKKYKESGEEKLATAVWEPIVDEVTFERVQKKLKKNKSRKKPHSKTRYPYILSGLTYCMTCGDVMCGKSAHGSTKKIGYYEHSWSTKKEACLTKKTFNCKPTRVPAKKLDPLVLEKVAELITDRSFSKRLLDKVQNIHQENSKANLERSLQSKIYDLNSQLDALAERLSELPKSISAAPVYKQMEVIESRKVEAREQIKALEDEGAVCEPASLRGFDVFREKLRRIFLNGDGVKADTKLQGKVIEKLVQKVEVGPDSVRVLYFVGKGHIEWESASLAGSRDFVVCNSSNSLTCGARGGSRTPTPCGTRS